MAPQYISDEEHCQVDPRSCCADFLADKQLDTRECVNHRRQVRPNSLSEALQDEVAQDIAREVRASSTHKSKSALRAPDQ
jgi:hypothetical protein